MRERLLASTLAIAVACVLCLGVPLALLARHQVLSGATARLRAQAAGVATDVEDTLDAGAPVDLRRAAAALPGRRIVVRTLSRPPIEAGADLGGRLLRSTVVLPGGSVTVEQAAAPVVATARAVTLVVTGLAAVALLAAVVLAARQSRRLAGPVAGLAARATALGRGEPVPPPVASGVPEIDSLATALDQAARRMSATAALQRDFAADAAHQLRTPLTGISLRLEEMRALGGSAVAAEADRALDQVERLEGVITALLRRARGDAVEPEWLDLAVVVRRAAEEWAPVLAAAGRELRVDARAGAVVRARADHLLGVVGALLDNAAAHGEGTVEVTVGRHDGAVELRVSDAGPGVAPELASSVFDRLVSGAGGTGIGLALARALAGAEGGTLRIDPDRPATFVLDLPVHAGAPGGRLPA